MNKNTVLARELCRIAKMLIAFEMTENEWRRYKELHPNANRANHHIIKEKQRAQQTIKKRQPHSDNAPMRLFHRSNQYEDGSSPKCVNIQLTKQAQALVKSMQQTKVSLAAQDEILWNHTYFMQQLCKVNPNIKIAPEGAFAHTDKRTINIRANPNDWFGCRWTCTHEYGHYIANSIFDIEKTYDQNIWFQCAIKDYKLYNGQISMQRYKGIVSSSDMTIERNLIDQLAQEKFKISCYKDLNFQQQWKITAFGDILGSISTGDYGFGHQKTQYIQDFYREAFANIYLVYKYGWTEFQQQFPAMWKYMEVLLNGQK